MSWFYRPYVSAAERRAKAAREMAKFAKKGIALAPVHIEGRKIAHTFWGNAWCDNLESYSDYSNRLPRGRTYVRNGSVLDLQISEGQITAMVNGSEIYKIEIKIKPLPREIWSKVQTLCSGKIDSLLELLQGRISQSVMQIVTNQQEGLFPKPREITMKCSCPDWAGMCKHLAATLYGIGARLDHKPELLFRLRGVDPSDLISSVSAAQATAQAESASAQAALDANDLSAIFGIDVETQSGASNESSQAAPSDQTKPVKSKRTTRTKNSIRPKKAPGRTGKGKTAARATRKKTSSKLPV